MSGENVIVIAEEDMVVIKRIADALERIANTLYVCLPKIAAEAQVTEETLRRIANRGGAA
jgi:hypothetical protein